MELHVAENYYHALGCCEATCSFHFYILAIALQVLVKPSGDLVQPFDPVQRFAGTGELVILAFE